MITKRLCWQNGFLSSKYLRFFVLLPCLLSLAQAQYDDVRCKCVCPKDVAENNVFVKYVKVADCTCKYVVKLDESLCLRCQCKYEARNTTLIKVVVIFTIVIIFILVVYLIGLSIYSLWKPEGLSITSDVIQERLIARSTTLSRIDNEVSRWKANVGEQRKNVYNNHTMLS